MSDLISRIPDHELIGFCLGSLGILGGTLVVLTSIVAGIWSRLHQRNLAAPLIEQMVAQGMSAEEIAEVFQAAWGSRSDKLVQSIEPGQRGSG